MFALLNCVMDRVFQASRVIGITVFRRHIEVADQHQLGVLCHLLLHPVMQSIQPAHLVGKFFRARFLAIDEIAIDETNLARRAVNRAGNNACLLIFKTGNIAHHIARRSACNPGHAVIGLLAKANGGVARFLKSHVWKLIVRQFELLQAQRINGIGLKPVQHLRQAHRQGVDIPGGYFHFLILSGFRLASAGHF